MYASIIYVSERVNDDFTVMPHKSAIHLQLKGHGKVNSHVLDKKAIKVIPEGFVNEDDSE